MSAETAQYKTWTNGITMTTHAMSIIKDQEISMQIDEQHLMFFYEMSNNLCKKMKANTPVIIPAINNT